MKKAYILSMIIRIAFATEVAMPPQDVAFDLPNTKYEIII